MKTIITYQCEICGIEYGCKEAALYCEAQELSPCPLKEGDKVEAYERYEEPQLDEVVSVRVGPSYVSGSFKNSSETVEEFNAFLKRIKEIESNISTHEWLITLKQQHKYGKGSDAYTNEYRLNHLKIPGFTKWLDGSDCRS